MAEVASRARVRPWLSGLRLCRVAPQRRHEPRWPRAVTSPQAGQACRAARRALSPGLAPAAASGAAAAQTRRGSSWEKARADARMKPARAYREGPGITVAILASLAYDTSSPSRNTSTIPQRRNSSSNRKARPVQGRVRPRAAWARTTTMPARCTRGPRTTVVSRMAASHGHPRAPRMRTQPGMDASRVVPCRRRDSSGKAWARPNRISAVTNRARTWSWPAVTARPSSQPQRRHSCTAPPEGRDTRCSRSQSGQATNEDTAGIPSAYFRPFRPERVTMYCSLREIQTDNWLNRPATSSGVRGGLK